MSDKLKKDYKDDKKMDKKDTKERDMKRGAIIRAVQNHPIIWKTSHSYKDKDHKDKKDKDHKDKKDKDHKDKKDKDKKYTDSQSHGGALSQAWALVAAETYTPEKDAEKIWSKLVKEFESNYEDVHYYGNHGNLSASASTGKGTAMECDKCKFWKPMNFYKEYLDSQKFPNLQRSAAPAPASVYPPQSNLINSGMGINAPPHSVIVDRNFGWVVNETNPAGSGVSYTNSLTLGDAHREIDAGLMTKEKFLQYLGNILNSVPIAHLGNCEKRLLEVAVGSALS